ncbi:hypothetical protein AVE30378_03667 [Achromobacter veterisilvae]|uniref:Polysaccharide chain length determinant N-terminal domain-containing protein n=1 Tax=Achromobacter veterisilvae TaxID=2069367 RepID=A0A446CP64_9BURK|nr:hypothetical protein [Achromobacter veterisilvae]SSW69702.1 hypothetical protein AVE30378_03667 [Achromobacter veterisilvae]
MNNSHSVQTPIGNEFSLSDIITFFRNNIIVIFSCGAIGLLVGAVHIWTTPRQYETVGLIKNALTTSSTNARKDSSTPQAAVEDTSLTIARLQIPTTYPEAVIKQCEAENEGALNREAMLNIVRPTVNRLTAGAIDLRVRRQDPTVAQRCAEAVFEMVRQQQTALNAPVIKSLEEQRANTVARMDSNQDMIKKMDSAQEKSVVYLIARDDIYAQRDRLNSIENDIAFINRNPTTLLAPWYTSNTPVLPKVRITLLAGLLAGLLVGVLYALIRQIVRAGRP